MKTVSPPSRTRLADAAPSHEDSALTLLRSTSLATVIQEKIERMILEGELKPGQRLNEFALAQAFGVSRSPVREACRMLEQAGMVEIITNRGMFVRSVDFQQRSTSTPFAAHWPSCPAN